MSDQIKPEFIKGGCVRANECAKMDLPEPSPELLQQVRDTIMGAFHGGLSNAFAHATTAPSPSNNFTVADLAATAEKLGKNKPAVGFIVSREAKAHLIAQSLGSVIRQSDGGTLTINGIPFVADPDLCGVQCYVFYNERQFLARVAEIERKRMSTVTFTAKDAYGKSRTFALKADIPRVMPGFTGPTTDENIHARIAAWHEAKDNTQKLHDFLGLSFESYAKWVETDQLEQPSNSLHGGFDIAPEESKSFFAFFDGISDAKLRKQRRRSAKAAAYQARRYVAKTVKRERRKDRRAQS